MDYPVGSIMNLPDEIIIKIWNNLQNIDVIYSFMGVNKRFDRLVRDSIYTRSIQLIKIHHSRVLLDCYCLNILPKINHLIESLTIDSFNMERILLCGDYPHLHKLTLTTIRQDFALHYFTDESPFIKIFKNQILYLVIPIDRIEKKSLCIDIGKNIVTRIFRTFENLTNLDFGQINDFNRPLISIYRLSPMICCSSSIVSLRIIVNKFDDCLCLFDGRLNQLRKLYIRINQINIPILTIDNLKGLSNMKCLSLTSYGCTKEYDNQILPFIRQMTDLEELILYICVSQQSALIDGIHLENKLLVHMSRLQTFIFNIVTYIKPPNIQINIQSNNDIRRTFFNWRYGQADGYIDYYPNEEIRSHIYSLPYNMIDMYDISNNFPGGLFTNVRILHLSDSVHPFEHDFFLRIAHAFPLITDLTILNNRIPNNIQSHHSDDNNSRPTTPVIEFLHVTSLTIHFQKVGYVEQFLVETNTYLPSLSQLIVSYKNLAIVTENFTRDATRRNCSKVQTLKFTITTTIAHTKNFYL